MYEPVETDSSVRSLGNLGSGALLFNKADQWAQIVSHADGRARDLCATE